MDHWYFYHQLNQTRKDDISKSDAITWIKSLQYVEIEHWLCWQEGYSNWAPVLTEKNFIPHISAPPLRAPPPPPPPPLPILHETSKTFTEKRTSPRVNIKLRAVLTNKKNTFVTFTKNISLSGILTENEIPLYIFSTKCEIYLTGPQLKESIVIQCMATAKDNNRHRLQFTQISDHNQKILNRWLFGLTETR